MLTMPCVRIRSYEPMFGAVPAEIAVQVRAFMHVHTPIAALPADRPAKLGAYCPEIIWRHQLYFVCW